MWQASTEISNNYFSAVKEALEDQSKFDNFKSEPKYHSVVGMSEPWQSPLFYSSIKENPLVMENIEALKENDKYGNPINMMAIESHWVSPNTLRHIYTLCDVIKHFGPLGGKVIAELGVGYGATAFMIKTMFPTSDYYLLDIPNVQALATKYLANFNIKVHSTTPPRKNRHIHIRMVLIRI